MSDAAETFTVNYWGGEQPTLVDSSTGHTLEEATKIVDTFEPSDEKRAASVSQDGDSEYMIHNQVANGVMLSCGMMYTRYGRDAFKLKD